MKKIVALILTYITVGVVYSQGSYPVWNKDFAWGGSSQDKCMDVMEIQRDYTIVAAGHTTSSKTGDLSSNNKGLEDYWVLKMDTAENILWEYTFGGDTTEQLAVLLETEDNGYLLAGSSASGKNGDKSTNSKGGFDFWIVKISENGSYMWDRTIGGDGDDILTCAVLANDGGIYLGGSSNSEISGDKSDPSYGYEDFWLVKVNATGNVVWDYTFGGDSVDVMTSIYNDNSSLYVGGYSISDSSGVKSNDSYGGYDFWVLNIETNGDVNWDTIYGGDGDDYLKEIRDEYHGNGIWVSGTTHSGASGNKSSGAQGNGDFWVMRLDQTGSVEIDKTFGSSNVEELMDMEPTAEGSIILAGYGSGGGGSKSSGTNGVNDYWLIKIDSTGSKYWDRNYGGSSQDTLTSVFIKCDRGLLVGGYSMSPISGDRSRVNLGENDYWVFKLDIPTNPKFLASNVCTGVPLNFYDESDIWPDSWQWDFDDPLSANNASTDQHPIHTYSVPGVYNVSMTIKEGCQKDTTLTKQINVYDNTVLGKLDLGSSFSVCEGVSFTLENQEYFAPTDVSYLWNTGDTTPTITKDSVGWYFTTMSDANCSVTDSVEVGLCPGIFIPNAFTPNGDEINETYRMHGFGIREFELLIFNRWGQLIFTSTDINEEWDGTYNGKKCQIDVYVYKVRYKGVGTVTDQKIGHISLLR